MPPVSLMIKPASSLCNMRCKYCFYHSLAEQRESASHGMMSEATLRRTLEQAFAYADGKPVAISFQGGEPLLAGKEFFAAAERSMLRELDRKHSPVSVGVQTNGTLLDEEWCRMFRSFGWLVGLSLDGDRAANALRVDADGEPTFDRVYAAAKLLEKNRTEFNILSVLTGATNSATCNSSPCCSPFAERGKRGPRKRRNSALPRIATRPSSKRRSPFT